MKTTRGFTILELLVTMTVVAVLVAILFTSVGRVRKNVNTTRCISNLRDISAALFACSAEHNESVMPKVSRPNVQWHAVIDKYLGGRGPDINSLSVTSKSWACPQNKKHRCYSADKKHLKTSKLLSKFIVMN